MENIDKSINKSPKEQSTIEPELKAKIEVISKVLLVLAFTQTFTLCVLIRLAIN